MCKLLYLYASEPLCVQSINENLIQVYELFLLSHIIPVREFGQPIRCSQISIFRIVFQRPVMANNVPPTDNHLLVVIAIDHHYRWSPCLLLYSFYSRVLIVESLVGMKTCRLFGLCGESSFTFYSSCKKAVGSDQLPSQSGPVVLVKPP